MTPHELALECKRVIEDEFGLNKVCLVIPGPPPRGERIRLDRSSRKKCPMGEVVSWTERGTVAYFDAIDVLAWLAAQGFVEVQGVSARVAMSRAEDAVEAWRGAQKGGSDGA